MPLSPNATLEGLALPRGAYTHVYVQSSCGAIWGCNGGKTGGVPVCSGLGSSIVADCIDGRDNAGIVYATTGVCVQIANRILSPANVQIPLTTQHARKANFLYTA